MKLKRLGLVLTAAVAAGLSALGLLASADGTASAERGSAVTTWKTQKAVEPPTVGRATLASPTSTADQHGAASALVASAAAIRPLARPTRRPTPSPTPTSTSPSPTPTSSAAQTVVSLTFDDSNADQLPAATTMHGAGLTGTFYTITGAIGASGYLTLAQLQQIYSYGDEIGGHTVDHPSLIGLPSDEVLRQICYARQTLTNWGFPQKSFAYPFADLNASVEGAVQQCGYNSARGLGDIRSRFGCSSCPYAAAVPPADPYDLQALDEVDSTWTLQDLQNAVTNAETHGGGWVILTFHHICVGCDPLSITPTLFASFVSWLQQHVNTTSTTTVKTVDQVIGGATKPLVQAPAPPAVAGAITNSSLETAGTGGPLCWSAYAWGTNTPAFSSVGPGHTGSVAEQIKLSGYSSGAAGLYPTFDTGGCTPSATPGHTYRLSAWYKSTVPVQFAVYYRNANGGFTYWTSSPYLSAASGWTQAAWTTPALPDGASGISFGLSIFSNGTMTVDDFGYVDAASLPAPLDAMGNASLESAGLNGLPECWTPDSFGTNNGTYTQTSPGHTGNVAGTVKISTYTSGAIQLLPTLYGSTCAPSASPGVAYQLSSWYQSNVVTQFVLYYETADGTWNYWTSSPWLSAAAGWTLATWTTPQAPAGTVRIAFGLSLFSVGTLSTDDYGFAAAS